MWGDELCHDDRNKFYEHSQNLPKLTPKEFPAYLWQWPGLCQARDADICRNKLYSDSNCCWEQPATYTKHQSVSSSNENAS